MKRWPFVRSHRTMSRRRGTIVIFAAICMVLILGMAALAIDLANLGLTRTELQRAADSAALAGVSAYVSNSGLAENHSKLFERARDRAQAYSVANTSAFKGVKLASGDIAIGAHDFDNRLGPLDASGAQRFNAVEVLVRRTPGGLNGGVPFFFAGIFGESQGAVAARARAVYDDRFAGFRPRTEEKRTPTLLPFTVHVNLYNTMVASGADQFAYDGQVRKQSDGVREVSIYPWKIKTKGNEVVFETEGGGNWGIVNINTSTTPEVINKITNGLTMTDVEKALGVTELTYYNADGAPNTYAMDGTPGMRTAMVDALTGRIGDLVGFFLHDDVVSNGTGTTYRNVGIRFGRVMEINLHGAPNSRRIVIQPVAYSGPEIIVHEGAPSSHGQVGRIMLAQ